MFNTEKRRLSRKIVKNSMWKRNNVAPNGILVDILGQRWQRILNVTYI